MVVQARAVATRQRILDAAVDVFSEKGYGDSGLSDVLERADVSKGAFYYHFESKESLAEAIIAAFDERLSRAVDDAFDPSSPTLEGIVRATFAVQQLMRYDRTTRIGQMLAQALGQVSDAGAGVYRRWTKRFVDMVAMVINAGELRRDVDPDDVAEAIWVAVLGSHLVSAAVGDDCYARLARLWRVLLGSALREESIPSANAMLERVAGDYCSAPA